MVSTVVKISSNYGGNKAVTATTRRGNRRGSNNSNGDGAVSARRWRRQREGNAKTMETDKVAAAATEAARDFIEGVGDNKQKQRRRY